ncbi:MAG: hypothetical protein HY321_05215 [Armatimonadetes bacterium]|nr:hypothetical protein [Armatimonadota bacterium]
MGEAMIGLAQSRLGMAALLGSAGILLGCLASAAGAATGGPGGWLNVRDLGASGSEFETAATTTAASKEITVKDVGDFQVGQGVILSGCHIHYPGRFLWSDAHSRKPLEDAVEIRGYDGSGSDWMVFILDVDGAAPASFRWSDDVARTWKASRVPITGEWQLLSHGVEVRFSRRDWKPGDMVTFYARNSLHTTIERIQGNVITLKDAPNRTGDAGIVWHEESAAIQAVIDRAAQEKKNVFFPAGHYRLARGIDVSRASGITLEGADGVNTLLDISCPVGPTEVSQTKGAARGGVTVFTLNGGTEVTLRNFRMVGHSGLAEKAGTVTNPAYSIWGMHIKPCNAVSIHGTERVLVENVHASRMSTECFFALGGGRRGAEEPRSYTKSVTYLRCSVSDCGFNAFNNNDISESTSILYCRVENIGNCFWEGPGRFIRIIGNYARNAGVCAAGNYFFRDEHLLDLGVAQTIISDNVFEGVSPNRAAIHVGHNAQQVIIANNLFINYGSTGVHLDRQDKSDFYVPGRRVKSTFPAGQVIVANNIMDLTYNEPKARPCTGIDIGLSDVIVSGNQVYVRGGPDPQVTGICVREPAINVNVHDNLVRNCGAGITTGRVEARVGQVVDDRTFVRRGRDLPQGGRDSHLYRGWSLAWLGEQGPVALSTIERFDPVALTFRLRDPRPMMEGDRFEVFPPSASWSIHDNTITGCLHPVTLDCYGSDTSLFQGNIVERGGATGVSAAVVVAGRFQLLGNSISGFDEKGAAGLALAPDRFGKAPVRTCRGNTLERCSRAVDERRKGLWKAAAPEGNRFIECGSRPGR